MPVANNSEEADYDPIEEARQWQLIAAIESAMARDYRDCELIKNEYAVRLQNSSAGAYAEARYYMWIE